MVWLDEVRLNIRTKRLQNSSESGVSADFRLIYNIKLDHLDDEHRIA